MLKRDLGKGLQEAVKAHTAASQRNMQDYDSPHNPGSL